MISIIDQIRTATAKTIRGDLLAGLTVAIMVIPQGMAYAMLAGLPPVYGLYAALIPVMVLFFYLPYNWSSIAAAVVFILASVTDWLD